MASSTNIRTCTQFFPLYASALTIDSMLRFYRSVWPSVWGWEALLNTVRIPSKLHNAFQKAAVKRMSWLWITYHGTPKNLTQLSKNNYATCSAVSWPSPALQGTNQFNLPNLSTITINALLPLISGKSVIKLMVHMWNFPSGRGNGYRRPAGCIFTSLVH